MRVDLTAPLRHGDFKVLAPGASMAVVVSASGPATVWVASTHALRITTRTDRGHDPLTVIALGDTTEILLARGGWRITITNLSPGAAEVHTAITGEAMLA